MTWSLEKSVAYECAREAINEVLAIRVAELAAEEAKIAPNLVRVLKLEREMRRLADERRQLMPEDAETIERIRTVYGTQIREHVPDKPLESYG